MINPTRSAFLLKLKLLTACASDCYVDFRLFIQPEDIRPTSQKHLMLGALRVGGYGKVSLQAPAMALAMGKDTSLFNMLYENEI